MAKMGYVEGFVAAVPAANKEIYKKHAQDAAKLFLEYGATRHVECWEDDVPDGQVTDFRRSVQAKDGEVVVFAWVEYPSREVRDEVNRRMGEAMREQDMLDMPFDGKRMIFGGFAPLLDVVP